MVELNGFIGTCADTELAQYFLENAASLEKKIIDYHKLMNEEHVEVVRERATLLLKTQSVELVVL